MTDPPAPAPLGPILVGVDFSPSAAEALSLARVLAVALGTRVDPIHVVEGEPATDWRDDADDHAWLRGAQLDPEAVTVRVGLPWVELARRAHETQPLLVVVGSHGRAGYQPVALGSTAGRLAVASPAPVVIVGGRLERSGSVGSTLATPQRGRPLTSATD